MYPKDDPLWRKTPLVYSEVISARLGCDVYLKLETFQPSHSFKIRSQSSFAKEALAKHGPTLHLVIASSGNAALSLAQAAHSLGVKCTVFITDEAAKKPMLDALERVGATPSVGGKDYPEALARAQAFVKTDDKIVMAPSYDHPTLWEGNSSMILEIAEDLPQNLSPPDAILCCVGGGSLLGGTLVGCEKLGWNDTTIVALETKGADCFYHSVMSSESSTYDVPDGITVRPSEEYGVKIAHLSAPTSRASSLGAISPSHGIVKKALERRAAHKGGLISVIVPDELSMKAGLGFADDQKMLVELASSTTLTPAYSPALFSRLFGGDTASHGSSSGGRETLVFLVCGGFKVSLADLQDYQAHLKTVADEIQYAMVDGGAVRV